jgi:hypothetical protein
MGAAPYKGWDTKEATRSRFSTSLTLSGLNQSHNFNSFTRCICAYNGGKREREDGGGEGGGEKKKHGDGY